MTDDNPPAFPVVDGDIETRYGMTLRDYFAAAALPDVMRSFNWTDERIQAGAAMCYRLADAMIAERDK